MLFIFLKDSTKCMLPIVCGCGNIEEFIGIIKCVSHYQEKTVRPFRNFLLQFI